MNLSVFTMMCPYPAPLASAFAFSSNALPLPRPVRLSSTVMPASSTNRGIGFPHDRERHDCASSLVEEDRLLGIREEPLETVLGRHSTHCLLRCAGPSTRLRTRLSRYLSDEGAEREDISVIRSTDNEHANPRGNWFP